jgi:hypothetical protein
VGRKEVSPKVSVRCTPSVHRQLSHTKCDPKCRLHTYPRAPLYEQTFD